jgi:uncharacterized damage-inducible protein DinB
MKNFFSELFNYSQYCNDQLIGIFSAQPKKITEKSILLFSHILKAHHIWNHRIKSMTPEYTVGQLQQLSNFKSIGDKNYATTLQIVATEPLDKLLDYKISTGQPFQNTVQDILFYMINHSTHHRAQIATELKNQGIDPPISDYIFYKRK